MGALTLKRFPFELRGWDIEKFESIDPTDGFGLSTRVYISKQQIVQIEPDYNQNSSSSWLSDKGRQFFDNFLYFSCDKSEKSWNFILKSLFKTLYFFDFCKNKQQRNYIFTFVVENISIEILSLLIILSQNYSFVKIKRFEKVKLNNDLESNFQLNFAIRKNNPLSKSTLALLIANNPKYEGYLLNLNLRQRFLKGNFKCFVLGSMIDLTFPVNFLGTKLNIIKNITEGNNLMCQDLRFANNPFLIFNTEMFKRNDGKNTFKMTKFLNYSNTLNKIWNYNILNNVLSETSLQSIVDLSYLTVKDLSQSQYSSMFFINLTMNISSYFGKIIQIKILNCNNKTDTDKNIKGIENISFYLPIKMFYEKEESFINTEGLIKRTSKLISKKEKKDIWKLLRNFLKTSKSDLVLINFKDNFTIFYDLKKKSKFKNLISFHYNATHTINCNSFITLTNNQPIYVNKSKYKNKKLKLFNTKVKYWLNDFYIGGKDSYTEHSWVMADRSYIDRSQRTSFF